MVARPMHHFLRQSNGWGTIFMTARHSFAIGYIGLLWLALVPGTASAATIYVDNTLAADITNGTYSVVSRNATGRDGNAYRTVAAGVAAMVAGDLCYLRGGTYREIGIDLRSKNDGTESRPYTLSSYPGEWAVIDGGHASSAADQSVILASGDIVVSYWRFVRFEITGGGKLSPLASRGAGFRLAAKRCLFQHLYIHDNYATSVNWGAAGGLVLTGGSQGNVVEFCWFKGNGNPAGDVTTSNANLAIYADYKYDAVVTIDTASVQNEIRYNLFEGVSAAGWTPTGFVHKGFQRLTGYLHGDAGNPADSAPNDASYRALGDKIHHNIFRGHVQAIRADQDYVQIYNNIIDTTQNGVGKDGFAAIRTRDAYSERRGAFWPSVYNNTVLANGGQAVTLTMIKDGWNCATEGTTSDNSAGFAVNNLIDSADSGYDWKALSVNSGPMPGCVGSQPHKLERFDLSRNFMYRAKDAANVVYFERTGLTAAASQSAGVADLIWSLASPSPFAGADGAAKYTALGGYRLDGSHVISTGGRGGVHPYLNVQIPSYVGAVDPSNAGWVDTVLGLANPDNLRALKSTGPSRPTGVSIR
jgi:hypothetical protein